MKKLGMFAMALALLALTAAPALARSAGIEMDGRTYIFCEDAGGAMEGSARYEIDGKTFLVGADEVIVQEPGKPDRHIPLEAEASADATATEGTACGAAERISEVVAIASDEGEESAITYYICDDAELAQGSASAEGATAVEELSDGAAERISEVRAIASDDGEESAITYYVCDDAEITQSSASAEGATAVEDAEELLSDGVAERISEVRAIASGDGEESTITYYVCDDAELAQGSASAEGATAAQDAEEQLSDGAAERISEVRAIASGEGEESAITYYVCDDAEITQGSALAEGATAAQDDLLTRDWSPEYAAEYAPFAPYGLRCDAETGKLYYLGAPVRVFEDARAVDGGTAELDYFDEGGSVDVRSKRDADGALTGLEALSDEEFASRDLRRWTEPEPTRIGSATTDGAEPSPEERAAFFAPYAPFGLRYDAQRDALYINGRPVRSFLDVRSSNGESPTGGKFRGSMTQLRFDGEVDVTILRDYDHPDANGEGKLIGVEIAEGQ